MFHLNRNFWASAFTKVRDPLGMRLYATFRCARWSSTSIGRHSFTPENCADASPQFLTIRRLANTRGNFSMTRRTFLIESSQNIYSSRAVFTLFGEQTQLATMWIFMLTMIAQRRLRRFISCDSKCKSRQANLTTVLPITLHRFPIRNLQGAHPPRRAIRNCQITLADLRFQFTVQTSLRKNSSGSMTIIVPS